MTSPSLTVARLMLTELEAQLREPVDYHEARQTADALMRHLKAAEIEAALPKSIAELAAEYHARTMDFVLGKIFNPAPR